jgi:hypothetical protein
VARVAVDLVLARPAVEARVRGAFVHVREASMKEGKAQASFYSW